MKRTVWRMVKWASLLVSAGSVMLAVVLMSLQDSAMQPSSATDEEQPRTRVEKPVLVERKDGDIVWQLRAEEANQQLDGKMHLIKPTLILFTKDEREIPIESKQAWLDPLQRNIRFQDNVIVHYESWDLYTEVMIYESSSDQLHIPESFKISGETLHAHGADLRLNRETEVITVDKGIWIEDSSPQWLGVMP